MPANAPIIGRAIVSTVCSSRHGVIIGALAGSNGFAQTQIMSYEEGVIDCVDQMVGSNVKFTALSSGIFSYLQARSTRIGATDQSTLSAGKECHAFDREFANFIHTSCAPERLHLEHEPSNVVQLLVGRLENKVTFFFATGSGPALAKLEIQPVFLRSAALSRSLWL